MIYGERIYKQRYCPFRISLVKQGIYACLKGRGDCDSCEFQLETEVRETWASIVKTNNHESCNDLLAVAHHKGRG